MPHCHDMKEGDIYICAECGLQIEVVKECQDCDTSSGECTCSECRFICCEDEMKLKS